MRLQVPAFQVRIGAMALAAIALVPIELSWVLPGFFLMLVAILLCDSADRLDELALRPPPRGWTAFVAPALALIGIALAGDSAVAFDLALLVMLLTLAVRWRRLGGVMPWMVLTPATLLVLLIIGGALGFMQEAYRLGMLAAIASAGALILRRPA